MGTIIFLMWIADVSDKLQIVAIIVAMIAAIAAFIMSMEGGNIKTPLIIASICLAFFTVIPSKQTVYGYVALYAGKEIVESKVGQKAYQALDSILDKVIQETGDKKEK